MGPRGIIGEAVVLNKNSKTPVMRGVIDLLSEINAGPQHTPNERRPRVYNCKGFHCGVRLVQIDLHQKASKPTTLALP